MASSHFKYFLWAPITLGLYYTAQFNYLLFHSLAEIFSAVIAFGIFMIAWNSRRILKNHFLLFIGIGYLFVGLLNLLHTLSYKGMPIFADQTANLPTQIWIAERYLQSLTFLIAPLFLRRRLKAYDVLGIYAIIFSLIVYAVFFACVFPLCYSEESGLTAFKDYSEYAICFIWVMSAGLLIYNRSLLNRKVLIWLLLSVYFSIITAVLFTLYANVYGFKNFAGHFANILSFFFIYKAIIEISLNQPYQSLFRELSLSESRFRNIFETAPLAFVLSNRYGRITQWNHAAEEIFGWSAQEVIGRAFQDFLIPESAKDLVTKTVTALHQGAVHNRSINENLTKSGDIILCEWNNSTFLDRDGHIEEILSLALDITEQKKAEEALERQSEMIKRFAYSVAHDLKSPAVSLYGLANLLSKKYGSSFDERAKMFCDQIMRISEQIGTLVTNINVFISSKEAPYVVETVDLSATVRALRDEFASRLEKLGIAWHEPASLPSIRADKLAIVRVLRNFIDNALKYGGEHLRTIEIGYQETPEHHVLSVRDDGIGLKGRALDKIFEFFNRQDNARGIEGSGLGLAIVKEIAEKLHGTVWTESVYGQGATFFISISKNL